MASDAFSEFCSWDNLLLSWKKAARGSRKSRAAASFAYNPGEKLVRLQKQLCAGEWRPGEYTHFYIHEPKRRLISAAPFTDRIVHHAWCGVLASRFESGFIGDSFANRRGKGNHVAVARLQQFCRKYRYVLRLDVCDHFASIDHAILLDIIRRKVPEADLFGIAQMIVASGADIHPANRYLFEGDDLLALVRPCGLPIGNLTSQLWSNCYLDPLDHFVKRTLRCSGYLRYVDDMALFSNSRKSLEMHDLQIRSWLQNRLRLRLHASQVQLTDGGVPWLGFVVYPNRKRIKSRKVVNATRKLNHAKIHWLLRSEAADDFSRRVGGWTAHALHADTRGLRFSMMKRLFGI